LKRAPKKGGGRNRASTTTSKKRIQPEREGLPDSYAPGHCTMCQIRWGRFDQPEDMVRVIRELQDIQEWLLYRRKYTNMTAPNGEDPEE